jgi:hypothetical protein
MTPFSYLWRVFGPGNPVQNFNPITAFDFNGRTVTLAHSFLYLGNEQLALFYHQINLYMIPFLLFYALTVVITYFNGRKIGEKESSLIILSTWILVGTHLFISRGVYKYYNAFLTPFIVISLLVFLDEIGSKILEKHREKEEAKEYAEHIRSKRSPNSNQKESQEATNQILLFFKKLIDPFEKNLVIVIDYMGLLLAFLGACCLFYYFNWILIVNSRFLHPFYLLILCIAISLLIPPSYYASLFKSKNYWTILKDLSDITKSINSFFIKYVIKLQEIFDRWEEKIFNVNIKEKFTAFINSFKK